MNIYYNLMQISKHWPQSCRETYHSIHFSIYLTELMTAWCASSNGGMEQNCCRFPRLIVFRKIKNKQSLHNGFTKTTKDFTFISPDSPTGLERGFWGCGGLQTWRALTWKAPKYAKLRVQQAVLWNTCLEKLHLDFRLHKP